MTAAAAKSTTTGVLPANTYLRVLGDSIVTITRDGLFVASQSTARDNFVGPYPIDSDYSVVAGDAAIDIRVTGEEGPTEALVPAKLSTDSNGNTVLVGGDGSTLISFDADGNLVASVVHRTDLLANLLATPGPLGELSVATDTDAIVVSQGATLAGKIYGRTSVVAEILLPGAFQTYNNTTYTLVPFDTIPEVDGYARPSYVRDLFTPGSDWFTAPPVAFASHISVHMDGAFTAGAFSIDIKLQYDNSAGGDGSSWTDLGIVSRRAAVANTQPGKKHRIQAIQNSGATAYGNLTPLVQFRKV